MIEKQNALVTGGAGFIGSHLCDALLACGHNVVAVDNLFLGKKENLQKGITFEKADCSDFKKMKKIISENSTQTVFDLATIPLPTSLEKPKWCFDEITKIGSTLCELHRKNAFDLLVHFSSSEAYGSALQVPMNEEHAFRPHTVYAAAKVAQDHLIQSYAKTYGLQYLIVRPFNNYGPRQNEGSYAGLIPLTIKRIQHGLALQVFGTGEQTRDFLFVSDTVQGTIALFEEKKARNLSVNLCSGKETTVNTIINSICREMNYSGSIEKLPARQGDVQRHCGDNSLAKKLVGFASKVSIEEGIKKTVEWYLAASRGKKA